VRPIEPLPPTEPDELAAQGGGDDELIPLRLPIARQRAPNVIFGPMGYWLRGR
jgi:hypothetical protein